MAADLDFSVPYGPPVANVADLEFDGSHVPPPTPIVVLQTAVTTTG